MQAEIELSPQGFYALEHSQYSESSGKFPFHIGPLEYAVDSNLVDFFHNNRRENKWQIVFIGRSLEECRQVMARLIEGKRLGSQPQNNHSAADAGPARAWHRIDERLPANGQRVEVNCTNEPVRFVLIEKCPIWINKDAQQVWPEFWRPAAETKDGSGE